MQNPWDILPAKDVGDADVSGILYAVGAALTTWERLDQMRAYLFGQLVNSRNGAAERAYGTVSSSAGRAEMIVTAAKALITDDPDLLSEILGLMTEVEKLSGRRNDLAHGIATEFTDKDSTGKITKQECFLVPAK